MNTSPFSINNHVALITSLGQGIPTVIRQTGSTAAMAILVGTCLCLPAQESAAGAPFKLLDLREFQRVEKVHFAEAKKDTPDQSWPAAKMEAIEAWKDLRFGMFIHWGPVSLTGKELSWSRDLQIPAAEYDRLPERFNPTKFDAGAWMTLAKQAGIRYVVPVAKHHDGFCMWPSRFTDYTIANTPFKRDIIGELAQACRAEGLRFGVYYSMPDWYHPDFPWTGKNGQGLKDRYNWEAYQQYNLDQTRELIERYGPILSLWNDKPDQYLGRGAATIRMARALQPDILVNNRTGNGGDFRTPEQKIGDFDNSHPWESCMTLSAHNQWSWGGVKDGVKPAETCLRLLINVVGGGGNMLLNVGPTPAGEIAPEQREVLLQMGAWLGKYGESIYATRGGPYKNCAEVASTHRGNTMYVHVLRWPSETLTLPGLGRKILASSLLTGGVVTVVQSDQAVQLTVAKADQQAVSTIVKLELDGPAAGIAPIQVGPPPAKSEWPTGWESGLTNVGDQMEQEAKEAEKAKEAENAKKAENAQKAEKADTNHQPARP
jgi:alpha-L-fucosidase